MEHGVFLPFLLQRHHLQSLEEFTLPTEERAQRGGEQRLAKTARATQENERAELCHLPHQVGLVDIHIPLTDDAGKRLYAYWVATGEHIFIEN